MRSNQLVLIENNNTDFRLDDRTREIGRKGIAAAREALRDAVRSTDERKAA